MRCGILFFIAAISLLGGIPEGLARDTETEPEWNVRHEVYLSLEEALKKAFPGADHLETDTVRLSPEARKRVAARVGHPLHEDSFVIYRGLKAGRLVGYAMAGEEVGKFRPITSLTVVGPDGKIQDVMVMIYRESHGSDVRRQRFLNQYQGKGLEDPLQINRDITSISGATISVRSMNAQARKALGVVHEAYFSK